VVLLHEPTRMHVFTHLKPASEGKTGLGVYPDGMVELDGYVGQLLDKSSRTATSSPPRRAPAKPPRTRRSARAGRRARVKTQSARPVSTLSDIADCAVNVALGRIPIVDRRPV
jgi:hypothetical protein